MDGLNAEITLKEMLKESPPAESDGRLRKRFTGAAFFAFFIILCVLIHYLNVVLTQSPTKDGHSRSRIIEIPPGTSVSDIADKLAEKQVISSGFIFKVAAATRGSAHELKAGEYRFDRSMSLIEVLGWLEEGHVMLHRLTVPEGLTIAQIAGLLANKGLASSEEIIRLANDPEFCKQLGVGGPNLEGFLYPDTYKLAKGLPAKAVIHIMVDRFWRKLAGEMSGEIDDDGKKLRDIVTIASIVEKEAQESVEKPLIAGVIYNRMHRNMPLQCDVTIRYPLDNYGFELTAED